MAVPVATIAKKVVSALASNKKGRKFLGYVVGIAVFIILIPVIVVFCVFGFTSGELPEQSDPWQEVSSSFQEILDDPATKERIETIETVFKEHDLPESDIHKAQFLSIKTLAGMELQDGFYEKLASCFTETTEDKNVYVLLEQTFAIDISAEDEARLDEIYGVTPARTVETNNIPEGRHGNERDNNSNQNGT